MEWEAAAPLNLFLWDPILCVWGPKFYVLCFYVVYADTALEKQQQPLCILVISSAAPVRALFAAPVQDLVRVPA